MRCCAKEGIPGGSVAGQSAGHHCGVGPVPSREEGPDCPSPDPLAQAGGQSGRGGGSAEAGAAEPGAEVRGYAQVLLRGSVHRGARPREVIRTTTLMGTKGNRDMGQYSLGPQHLRRKGVGSGGGGG